MTILTNKDGLLECVVQAYKEKLINEMDRRIAEDIIVDIEELIQEVKKLIPEGKSRDVAIEKLLQVKDHVRDVVNPEGLIKDGKLKFKNNHYPDSTAIKVSIAGNEAFDLVVRCPDCGIKIYE